MYQVQVEANVVTKYYLGGAFRINGAVYYALGDQLGSTNLVTDSAGAKVSELRYTAWGEVRFTDGTILTDKTYTGQRSNVADFGLMFYNARWYDAALGRFVQADTIVPEGIQGYDRYAYTNNNPVSHSDPSGHCTGKADDDNNPDIACWQKMAQITSRFSNVHFVISDPWTFAELSAIYNALVGHAFIQAIMQAASITFHRWHCPSGADSEAGSCSQNVKGGMTSPPNQNNTYDIYIFDAAYTLPPDMRRKSVSGSDPNNNFLATVVHELTHVALGTNPWILDYYLEAQKRANPKGNPDDFGDYYGFDASCLSQVECKAGEYIPMTAAVFQVSPDSLITGYAWFQPVRDWQYYWAASFYNCVSPEGRIP